MVNDQNSHERDFDVLLRMKTACLFVFVFLEGHLSFAENVVNCTVKEHLPCTLYKNVDDCSPPALLARFPQLYDSHSFQPSGAQWMKENMTQAPYMTYGVWPMGIFTFKPPHDGSISYVKGFEVQTFKPGSVNPKCYIYDLSNATWRAGAQDYETIFTLILHPMAPTTKYFLNLYSLPKLPVEYEQVSLLQVNTMAATTTEKDPFNWIASISYSVNTDKQEVVVSFLKPDEEYGFTEFEVTLRNLSGGERQDVYIDQYNYTFKDVVNGVYEIWVRPIQSSSCSCRESEYICKPCYTTYSRKNLTMDYEATTTSSTTPKLSPPIVSHSTDSTSTEPSNPEVLEKEDGATEVQVALAVVGSLLGIGLVVGMLLLYFFCRRRQEGDINDNYKPDVSDDMLSVVTLEVVKKNGSMANNNNAEKIILNRRPKLFVLFEEDHQFHRKVVDSFTSYLQNYCHCDVMCAQLQRDDTWVHQEIQQADYVVIVNSVLAHGIYRTLLKKKERTASGNYKTPGINCILQRFLQEPHYDKTVMVYFDYTSEDHIIPDICPGYNYQLMKHFTDFLLHIHKLKRTDNLSQYDLPLDGQYDMKPVGKELKLAIRLALEFERENSRWFSQNFAYLRSFSNTSDESGFDSGLPAEPPVLDPIAERLQDYMDATSQDAITITPAMGNLRGTPLSLSPHSFQAGTYNSSNHVGIAQAQETPTTGDSGQFEFIPPDDFSEFDVMSKTLSEQMMSINEHSCGHDNKAYDGRQDLVLLREYSGDIPFDDVHSLGGQSV